MRNVGGELFVGVDPVIKGRDHAAHGHRQATDFVRPRGQVGDPHPVGGIAAGVTLTSQFGGGGQIGQRVRDRRGQHQTKRNRQDHGDKEHPKDLFAFIPHQTVDLDRRRHQNDDPHDIARNRDRGAGRKEQASVLILAGLRYRLADTGGLEDAGGLLRDIDRLGLGGLPLAQEEGDSVPDVFQKVGQKRGLTRIGQQRLVPLPDLRGNDPPGRIKDEHFEPGVNLDLSQGFAKVKALRSRQQAALIDVGDQFDLPRHALMPLQRQAFAERVHEQDADHQNDQRQQVEDDDLAGKGRTFKRDKPAPCPAFLKPLDRGIGRYPVFAQKDVARPSGLRGDSGCRGHVRGPSLLPLTLRCIDTRCRKASRWR